MFVDIKGCTARVIVSRPIGEKYRGMVGKIRRYAFVGHEDTRVTERFGCKGSLELLQELESRPAISLTVLLLPLVVNCNVDRVDEKIDPIRSSGESCRFHWRRDKNPICGRHE